MLQYQLDQLDVFFFYDVGKKIYRPPSMMFDIHFFLHKRGRVLSLGSENEIALSFCIIAKLGALHTP